MAKEDEENNKNQLVSKAGSGLFALGDKLKDIVSEFEAFNEAPEAIENPDNNSVPGNNYVNDKNKTNYTPNKPIPSEIIHSAPGINYVQPTHANTTRIVSNNSTPNSNSIPGNTNKPSTFFSSILPSTLSSINSNISTNLGQSIPHNLNPDINDSIPNISAPNITNSIPNGRINPQSIIGGNTPRKKSTGKSKGGNLFGQIMISLKTIIDLLGDIAKNISNIGGKGKGVGSIRPVTTRKNSSHGGDNGILGMLKNLIPLLITGLAALVAGPAGQGMLIQVSRGMQDFGRQIGSKTRQFLKNNPFSRPRIKPLIPHRPQDNLPTTIRKNIGNVQRQITNKVNSITSGVKNSTRRVIGKLGLKSSKEYINGGKIIGNAAKGAFAVEEGYQAVRATHGLITGDSEETKSGLTHLATNAGEFASLAVKAKGIKGGGALGVLGILSEQISAADDEAGIERDKSLTKEQKDRAIKNRELHKYATDSEIVAGVGAQLLPGPLKALAAPVIAGIELYKGKQEHDTVDADSSMTPEQKKAAHEKINHETWKGVSGATGGLTGALGGAAAGAAIGSVVPVVGTAIGGIIGGGIGYFGGSMIGQKLGSTAESFYGEHIAPTVNGVGHWMQDRAKDINKIYDQPMTQVAMSVLNPAYGATHLIPGLKELSKDKLQETGSFYDKQVEFGKTISSNLSNLGKNSFHGLVDFQHKESELEHSASSKMFEFGKKTFQGLPTFQDKEMELGKNAVAGIGGSLHADIAAINGMVSPLMKAVSSIPSVAGAASGAVGHAAAGIAQAITNATTINFTNNNPNFAEPVQMKQIEALIKKIFADLQHQQQKTTGATSNGQTGGGVGTSGGQNGGFDFLGAVQNILHM